MPDPNTTNTDNALFTPAQWDTLRALVDRVIPPDDFPGGWEAGVGDYLTRQLSPGGDLSPLLPTYKKNLDALSDFAALEPDAQDAFLTQLSSGGSGGENAELARFFRALVEHAQEGFYSDPENSGGNRNKAAWQMIGFEVRG